MSWLLSKVVNKEDYLKLKSSTVSASSSTSSKVAITPVPPKIDCEELPAKKRSLETVNPRIAKVNFNLTFGCSLFHFHFDQKSNSRQSNFSPGDMESHDEAADILNDHLLSEFGMVEPSRHAMSEPSIFGKRTETWETGSTGSTTGDSGIYDDDDKEYFQLLGSDDAYFSDDDDEAVDIDDDAIEDCGPAFNAITGKFRANDADLRRSAMLQSVSELGQFECSNGNRGKCKFGAHCCAHMEVKEIWDFRSRFWDFESAKAPTTAERAAKINHILTTAFCPVTNEFKFVMEKRNTTRVQVCERSFLTMLRYRGRTSQWERCKAKVRKRQLHNLDKHSAFSLGRQEKSKPKFEVAKAWIRDYCHQQSDILIYQADLKRQGEFIECDDDEIKIKPVPYETVAQVFEEYELTLPSNLPRCKVDCFKRAFSSFTHTSMREEGFVVRLRRCKHNFSTCDICNNAQALLQDKARKWAYGQEDILRKYLKVHLQIQGSERDEEKRAILAARKMNAMGQPEQAFMLFDGFSVHKGVTPKWSRGVYGGRSHTQKEEPKVENRVIAGIVICGEIDTVFVYTVDQLTRGGANLMIEVIRQALSDLGELLKSRSQLVPKILYLQFDNCGENKNKYMMAYCSMLVESKRYVQHKLNVFP